MDVVGRDLVAETARAGVQHDDEPARRESERLGELRLEDLVDAWTSRKWFPEPSVPSWRRPRLSRRVADRRGVGAGEATLLLLDGEVGGTSVARLDRPSGAPGQDLVDLAATAA